MIKRLRRRPEESELNITSFMNLMVILVPFLLITAVFSQVAILQLEIPQDGVSAGNEEKLQLELILRGEDLIVSASGSPFDRVNSKDFKTLSDVLYKLKKRYPSHTEITLLLEPDTHYDTIIALMDAVRSKMISVGIITIELALFPEVSLGDAPGYAQKAVQ